MHGMTRQTEQMDRNDEIDFSTYILFYLHILLQIELPFLKPSTHIQTILMQVIVSQILCLRPLFACMMKTGNFCDCSPTSIFYVL